MHPPQKKSRITLGGDPGSGKSAVGALLKKNLGLPYHSTGSIQRELAQNQKMDTLAFNTYAEKHIEIDHAIDESTRNLAAHKDDFILDSRMAWHFIPDAFKVYLAVPTHIAGLRVYGDDKRQNEVYASAAEAAEAIAQRQKSEWARFANIYGVTLSEPRNYDLIVDTSHASITEATRVIMAAFKEWLSLSSDENCEQKKLQIALPEFILETEAMSQTTQQESTQSSDPANKLHSFYEVFAKDYRHYHESHPPHEEGKESNIRLKLHPWHD